MHNLTSTDKVFQVRKTFRNISGHSKNAFSYLTGLVNYKIYNLGGSHSIISVNGRIKFQMDNT